MKVAVVGSRKITNYRVVKRELDILKRDYGIDLIISGGARGVDSLAEKYAKENKIKTLIFKPDWGKYGKRAGFIRNKDIVENADMVVAFWDGKSKGTKHSIELARKLGKELKVFIIG